MTTRQTPTSTNGAFSGDLPAPPEALAMPFLQNAQDLSNEMQRDLAEMEQRWARAYGVGTPGDNNSILSLTLQSRIDASQANAQKDKDAAYFGFAQAGFGGATIISTHLISTRPMNAKQAPIKDQLEDSEAFKAKLQEPGSGDDVLQPGGANSPVDQKVADRMKEMERGDVKNFRGKKVDGSVDEERAQLNQDAVEHLKKQEEEGDSKKEAFSKINKAVDKEIESKNSQISSYASEYQNLTQKLNVGYEAMKAGIDAIGKIQSASDTAKAGKAEGAASLYQSNQQQIPENMQQFRSQADQKHQDANAINDKLLAIGRNSTTRG